MPGIRESALKAPTGGRFLPQGPRWCKRADGAGRGQNRQKSARTASTGTTRGQSGSHPLFLRNAWDRSSGERCHPPGATAPMGSAQMSPSGYSSLSRLLGPA